jgi:tetratricopeptide (TPR) repeat protein
MSENILSDQEEKIARVVLGEIFQDDVNFEACMSMAKAVMAGKTFGQGLGLKENDLEVILGLAASCYMAARYEDATRLYSFAALLNHFDTRALQGAGMASQKLGSHEAALQYFGAILLQDPENLQVITLVAESMAKIGKKQEALVLLRQIAELKTTEQQTDGRKTLSDRVTALISMLTKDLGLETK